MCSLLMIARNIYIFNVEPGFPTLGISYKMLSNTVLGGGYITSTLSWLSKSSLQLLYFVTTARSQVLEKGDYSCAIQIVYY